MFLSQFRTITATMPDDTYLVVLGTHDGDTHAITTVAANKYAPVETAYIEADVVSRAGNLDLSPVDRDRIYTALRFAADGFTRNARARSNAGPAYKSLRAQFRDNALIYRTLAATIENTSNQEPS